MILFLGNLQILKKEQDGDLIEEEEREKKTDRENERESWWSHATRRFLKSKPVSRFMTLKVARIGENSTRHLLFPFKHRPTSCK